MRSRRVQRLFLRYREHADGAALAAVFDATAPRLLELACHLAPDSAAAEDLVQSTFLAAIRDPHRYDERAPVEAWLYGILWREAQKARRHVSRFVDPADPQDMGVSTERDPAEALAVEELPLVVREALEKLPRHERDVLEPFLLEDLRADEIARKLQRSAGTVRSQIHRALERLRRHLPASLTPMAGVIPIRGLDAVRGEVLTAAGFPTTTAAALVGAGLGSRALLVGLSLTLALGGWVGVRSALAPAKHASKPETAKFESEPVAPVALAASPSSSDRAPVLPAGGTGARIALTVVDSAHGNPAGDVHVEVWPGSMREGEITPPGHEPDQTPVAQGRTDSAGRIDLALPAGQPMRIEVPAWGKMLCDLTSDPAPFPGAVSGIAPLGSDERRAVRMEVFYGRQYSIFGRVSAEEDGRPVGRAAIIAFTEEPENKAKSIFSCGSESAPRRVVTDGDGRFELKLTYLQLAMSKFAVVAEGFGPVLFGRTEAHATPAEPLEIKLARSAILEGRVVADESTLLGDVSVQLSTSSADLLSSANPQSENGWQFGWPLSWQAKCARDGTFRFPQLPPGVKFGVELRRENRALKTTAGEAMEPLTLEPGQTRRVEWKFRTGARVTGVALDRDLDPVPNHEIWLLRTVFDTLINPGPIGMLIGDDSDSVVARTRTDAKGHFVLEGVATGTWWVGIAPDPSSLTKGTDKVVPLAVEFDVPDAVPAVEVTIKPKNTLTIRGKVLSPDGSPVWAAEIVMARGDNDFGPESGVSAQDGSFTVLPVEGGTWKLRARGGGFVESDPVEAQAGQDGVVLKLKIAAGISGEVVCADCGEERLLYVSILGEEISQDQGRPFGHGQSFEFGGLRAGTYHVLAQCEPDRVCFMRDIQVKAGAVVSNVHVELTTGAVLVLRYTGNRDCYNFDLWLGDVTAGSKSVAKGPTRRIIVPPGIVKLRPDAGGSDRVLTVRAGTETEVVLDDN
jgi:RNA polymerase sigma-70 factor (ECF subfamily)